jgi:hypothetical protein
MAADRPRVQSWEIRLACVEQAVLAITNMYLLVALPGSAIPWKSHRAFQLTAMTVMNILNPYAMWSVQKRQVFYLCMLGPLGNMLGVADVIWESMALQFALKVAIAVLVLVYVTMMRRVAARLGSEATVAQLTAAQKILFATHTLNSALLWALPRNLLIEALGMLVWALFLLDAWKYYLVFRFASRAALGTASAVRIAAATSDGTASSCPQTVGPKKNFEVAKKALGNVHRHMLLSVLVVSGLVVVGLLLSSFFEGNCHAPGIKIRLVGNITPIEATRFYVCDVLVVMLLVGNLNTVIFFAGKKREKKSVKPAVMMKVAKKELKELLRVHPPPPTHSHTQFAPIT